MIAGTHTVIDPRAVVVEPLYAVVTEGAVPGPLCSDNLAVGTQTARIELLDQVLKM